jgi:hypothetical protein
VTRGEGRWHRVAYWDTPDAQRKSILDVPALQLMGTPMDGTVRAPAAVDAVDLSRSVWPADVLPRPAPQTFAAMSVAGCWADFRVAYAGAASW